MLYIIGHFHCQKKMIKRTHMGCIDQKLAFKHQTWTDQANRKTCIGLWNVGILVHLGPCPFFFSKGNDKSFTCTWFEHLFPLQHSWCSKIFCMIFHMVFHMFSHDFPAFLWFSICFPMLFGSYLACGGEMRRSLVAVRLFIFGSFFDCRKWSFFLLPWVSDVFAWQVQHFKACSLVAVRLRWPFLDRLWR